MASDKRLATRLRRPAVDACPVTSEDRQFFCELYWFVVLGLGGVLLALTVLPDRALQTLQLLERERQIGSEVAHTHREIERYERATEAVANDRYFLSILMRHRLGVHGPDESFPDLPTR